MTGAKYGVIKIGMTKTISRTAIVNANNATRQSATMQTAVVRAIRVQFSREQVKEALKTASKEVFVGR